MRVLILAIFVMACFAPLGCSRFPPDVASAKAGKYVPDIDPTTGKPLGLATQYAIPGEGRVCISLPSSDKRRSRKEWEEVVARADRDIDRLVSRVIAVRREVAPRVLQLQREWFPYKKWNGTADELMVHMRLTDVNYYGDGTFAVWYRGDDLFLHHDLDVELNEQWVIYLVKFDG
jgi:hypothetical protein